MRAHNSDPEQTTHANGTLSGSLKPITAKDFGHDQARHLLWRAGFGGTSAQINSLVALGPEKAVDRLLQVEKTPYETPKADRFDKDLLHPPTPEEQKYLQKARRERDEDALARIQTERQTRERKDREQARSMQQWWLARMIETPRPFEEKLTLFWHGHFATSYRTIENSYHMYQQNQLFRREGLGNFRALLLAIIRDPAMLRYLNNNDSRKNKPNENLARELMELFSLGVGNYTEKDIKEGARALTGFTYNDDEFTFDDRNHDAGAKTILGRQGNLGGDEFVEAILAQDACARYIVRRWYHYFVSDVPPDERGGEGALEPAQRGVLAEMARTFRGANYEIRPALRRLFLSEHFYEPRFMLQQIKSPVQLIVGAVRSLNTPTRDLSILTDALDLMGQNLLQPPSVKGWEGGRTWINTSTLFVRQNILTFLLTGKRPRGYDPSAETEPYDPRTLLADVEGGEASRTGAAKAAEQLLRVALGRVPGSVEESVKRYLASAGDTITRESMMGVLLLATAAPEYQLC